MRSNQLITTDGLFSARENIMKTNLEIYVIEILKIKEKFIRDKLAYDNKQAYNWAQSNHKGKRRNNRTCHFRQTTSEPNDSDHLLLLFPLYRYRNSLDSLSLRDL